MSQRLGVLGGTFDPIHHGHLVAAQEVLHQLRLERVLFVPAGNPPHKPSQPLSPAHDRVRMVELAIADKSGFVLSRVDVDRPGPHYTVEMLRLLHQEWGLDARFFFVIGTDSLAELPTWYCPEDILELADLAVVGRPGHQADLAALDAHLPGLASHLHWVSMPLLEISSTDLRTRVRQDRPISFLVPRAVERYIIDHSLYRLPEAGKI